MKMTLLGFLEKLTTVDMLAYSCIIVGALAIYYLFVRWVFGIEKRIKQNDAIIDLLKLIAKKQGINDDDIHNATH
jgi:hypothetical protein